MITNRMGPAPGRDERQGRSEEWLHRHLRDQTVESRKSPLARWYRLTTPPEPPPSASLARREAARRGLLASTLLFYTLLLTAVTLPIAVVTSSRSLEVTSVGIAVVAITALLFNRRGHSNITGLIIAVGLEVALVTVIRTTPGGLDPSMLGLFDLLVFVEVFVASLLPINWVIPVALLNIAFTIFDLVTQAPHGDALMVQVVHQSFFPVILRPVLMHVIITVVLWLWVRSATRAIERADRAEVIATLEHSIAEREHQVAEEKRLLDQSIQKILQTHIRVANGDFDARVLLTDGEPLWPVAGSLNNLLSRLQRLRLAEFEVRRMTPRLQHAVQLEQEFQRLKGEIHYAQQVVTNAEREQRSMQMRRSGTMLDPLIAELHGKYLFPRA